MATRSPIFTRQTPGLPVSLIDVEKYPGKILFVQSGHSAASDAAGFGESPDSPLATLDYAVGLCAANALDVILLMPGHNESLTAANGVDLDVAGINVLGLGRGSLKPTFDYDHANGEFVIGADNILAKNLRFRVSANAVTKAIDIEAGAEGYELDGLEFGWAETATDEFAVGIIINAGCNDGVIKNILMNAGAQAAVSGIKFDDASDNVQILDSRFIGAFSTAMINGITTLSTNLLIARNLFYQGATEPAIELLTGTTGLICNNYIKTNLATKAASIVADACYLFENYYNEDAGGTGGLIGTVSADD